MKKVCALILIALILVSCSEKDPNQEFDTYKSSFITSLWEIYPEWASSVGYHRFDSVLSVNNEAYFQRQLEFADGHLQKLVSFDLEKLSNDSQIDYRLMETFLQSIKWSINTERSHEWLPSSYNVSGTFAVMLANKYDSLDTRLRNFSLRLRKVPDYYAAAKQNIKTPTKEHTELAIAQNEGGLYVFTSELQSALQESGLSESEKKELTDRAAAAVTAINEFVTWLKQFDNSNPRSFRLGKELYDKKFGFDIQSRFTVDQVYQRAVDRRDFLHAKMAEVSNQLWTKYFPRDKKPVDTLLLIRQVIDKISFRHTQPDSFQSAIEKQIPELAEFVRQKDLLYLDPSKPLVVRKEPDYMAGVAGASITAPGPYDTLGNTYYNVGSLSGWDKDRSESYLREYNHYLLQILNIHEAIPGHYAQLVYSNKSPNLIRSILANGPMVEGWAVYTEQMMLENGYGNNEPEMWLMYYKWNLRTVCNTILDISVHTKNMSEEDAHSLLTREAFQQEAEARGKWRRVSLTSVQLCSYFSGYTEIADLREELMAKKGEDFNLKEFHEQFLSYGSIPVKYIRELMLEKGNTQAE